jgi:hypothetical protein
MAVPKWPTETVVKGRAPAGSARPEVSPPPGSSYERAVAGQKRASDRAAQQPEELKWDAGIKPQVGLAEFARAWLKQRPPGTRKADAERLRDHVLPLLGSRRVRELRAADVALVVRQMLAKKGMNVKSARNAYAVFEALLGDAFSRGLITEDPRALPDDVWPAEEAAPVARFSAAEVAALTGDERIDAEQRIYNALAFYSGLAGPALCQLRFGDWRQQVAAPIAAELAEALERWQRSGFEATFGRAPTDADWLVPRRSDVSQPHSEGSAFKQFRRACVALGIKTRSPRAIQNTFGPPVG